MPDVEVPSIQELFAQESASRPNTSSNAFKRTRERIAEILGVEAKFSKGVHADRYRNLQRLSGNDDPPFVLLEWQLGAERISATDPPFYAQDQTTREAAAVHHILAIAGKRDLKALVVALCDDPPDGPVERRFAAVAYRQNAYPPERISALIGPLGLDEAAVTVWPPASPTPPPPPGGGAPRAATGWRPHSRFHANLVLEGVPGTGKTYWVKEHANSLFSGDGSDVGARGDGAFAITLHPATSYEDFVEGLRPGPARPSLAPGVIRIDGADVSSGEAAPWFFCAPRAAGDTTPFQVHDGFFLRACAQAAANPEKGFMVLLDEFNRCNVPKVFGDLLTTLEASKRATWSQDDGWSTRDCQVVTLPYSGRQFFVPANVLVVATMNTTDRSVTGLDAALRRRFAFERVWPLGFRNSARAFAVDELTTALELPPDTTEAGALLRRTVAAWGRMNAWLFEQFGPDGMLGHSYLSDMERALAGDPRMWSAERPAETVREGWNRYLLPQVVEVFENGNALSALTPESRLVAQLAEDLKALGALKVEKPGGNPLLRRPSLQLWPIPPA